MIITSPSNQSFDMELNQRINSSGASQTFTDVLTGIVPPGWTVKWTRVGTGISGPSTANLVLFS
jgi:hypothetical protein